MLATAAAGRSVRSTSDQDGASDREGQKRPRAPDLTYASSMGSRERAGISPCSRGQPPRLGDLGWLFAHVTVPTSPGAQPPDQASRADDRFGGPEVMDAVDLPDPVPGPGQQLYEVSAV